jgi:hypothetical protein
MASLCKKGAVPTGILIPCSCPRQALLAGPDPQQTSSESLQGKNNDPLWESNTDIRSLMIR